MNDYILFDDGVADALADSDWLPKFMTIDYLVNELRGRLHCSDDYLAGYLNGVFNPQFRGVIS
jgi:hypothetical protein